MSEHDERLVVQRRPLEFARCPVFAADRDRRIQAAGRPRSKSLPNVPTLAEAGVPGYDFSSWYGLFAPGGTDPAIIEQLAREVKKTLAKPEVLAALVAQGVEPEANTPAEFKARVNAELSRWEKDVKSMKLERD